MAEEILIGLIGLNIVATFTLHYKVGKIEGQLTGKKDKRNDGDR